MDNNIKIDDALLEELGYVGLSDVEKQELQGNMLEALQMRIGLRLSEGLNDEQIAELESKFVFTADDTPDQVVQKQQAVSAWLEQNHPNYKEVVADEFEKLKQEMRSHIAGAGSSAAA